MYEWHGWATIRGSADNGDSHESFEVDEAAAVVVTHLLKGLPKADGFETWDVRRPNGQTHVWLAGYRNHRQERVVETFRQLGQLAPGSYGLLHLRDDELTGDGWNQWQRWVMARGAVRREEDSSLTPHVGRLEDIHDD